ncbi:dUTP diphosphatase [uncultured Marinobacter sp.]|uniref:dUTP diphosphatase n=1 Tax=uncultured Marinobacter sp. TaxID=187379 RepID=UPI00259977FF|nr:dUTP diphosphatase [uncultured Marinobacter sp.]
MQLKINGMNETVNPYILGDTPAVLSVGRRCRKLGYSFLWINGYKPLFVKNLPNGTISAVCLEVIGDIPYLKPDVPQPTEKALDDVLLREHGVLVIKNQIVVAKHMHFADASNYAVPSEDLTFHDQGNPGVGSTVGSSGVLRDTGSPACYPIIGPRGYKGGAFPGVQQEPEAANVDELRGSSTQDVNPYANDPRCEGCGSRYGELKDWKKYVQSEAHHFEHKPACTKYCDACMQGMTRDIKHMKGKFSRPINKFGDIITCDHTYMLHDEQMPGLGGFKEMFNMLSLHKNFRWSEPVLSADRQDTKHALQKFRGTDVIGLVYTDGGGGITSACDSLDIPFETSKPHDPQNNGVIERCGGVVLAHIRTRLVEAGLPSVFWVFACRFVCMMLNISIANGTSPYFERFNEEFRGEKIAFGELVYFRPSKYDYDSKADPRLLPGVFLGYKTGHGCKWSGDYWVVDLSCFANKPLAHDTPAAVFPNLVPHTTKVIRKPLDGTKFPLKAKYVWCNSTLEGIEHTSRGGSSTDLLDPGGEVEPEPWRSKPPNFEDVPVGPVDSSTGENTAAETTADSVLRDTSPVVPPVAVEYGPARRGRGRPRIHEPVVHPDAGIPRHLLKRVPDALGRLQPCDQFGRRITHSGKNRAYGIPPDKWDEIKDPKWRKAMVEKYGTLWDHIQAERAVGRVPFREKVVHEAEVPVETLPAANMFTQVPNRATPSPLGFLGLCYKNAAATLNGELVADEDTVSTDAGETDYNMLSDEEEWNVVSNDQKFFQEQFEEEANTYPQAWGDDQQMQMPLALPGFVNQRVLVKKVSPHAVMPTRGTEGAAGLDLSSVSDVTVPAEGKASIPTGLCIVPPKSLYGRIAPRSGLAYKQMIAIGAGVIDSDFTGELSVIIFNHGKHDFKVSVGDRIAQPIF